MSPPPSSATHTLTVRRPLVRPAGDGGRLLRTMRGWLVRRALALGAVLIVLCMLQVWLRLQVLHLGYDLSVVRQMQLRLEHDRRELEVERATLRDPRRIDDIARHRLGMVDARKGQVVTLR
ncbi:MAG TPA: cell division protein FtsL [Candidatus Binatia bacterium]|nr:cell division protein FtsL [Candidatus Binatia bacterium]